MTRSIQSWRQSLRDDRPEELGKKRVIKRGVREGRRPAAGHRELADPGAISIDVLDEDRFVHYPATPDDLRAILRLLPPGLADGIRSVEFCLGRYAQPDDLAPDPYTGRGGHEELPGVYLGQTLALYLTGRARVQVHAYVYDATRPECRVWEVALRLVMLSSVVHELAHHDDRTRRVARGRWLMDRTDHNEAYARSLQGAWTEQYVLPYILHTYPDQVRTLSEWATEHPGGMSLGETHTCQFARLVRLLLDAT